MGESLKMALSTLFNAVNTTSILTNVNHYVIIHNMNHKGNDTEYMGTILLAKIGEAVTIFELKKYVRVPATS